MKLNYLNKIIRPLGFIVKRSGQDNLLNDHSMYGGILRSKSIHKIKPGTVIDIGAAEGKWTLMTMEVWPNANYLMFEPLEERKKILQELGQKHKNIYLVLKAAGQTHDEIDFYVTSDLDGSGIAENQAMGATKRKIRISSIDDEVAKLGLKGPFIIKLDTHGYELPIIDGSKKTLKETELLIIECYGFKIAPSSLLFWEMCNYLLTIGFRLVDIVDISLRPKDGTFWQCDAFFIPINCDCFSSNTYQ